MKTPPSKNGTDHDYYIKSPPLNLLLPRSPPPPFHSVSIPTPPGFPPHSDLGPTPGWWGIDVFKQDVGIEKFKEHDCTHANHVPHMFLFLSSAEACLRCTANPRLDVMMIIDAT
jgi:hypothetical protein